MPTETWASLGVGGILAGVIFYFYVQRVNDALKQSADTLQTERLRSDALLQVVKENTASNTAVVKSVEANTAMVERLCQTREFSEWNDNAGRRQHLRPVQQPGG